MVSKDAAPNYSDVAAVAVAHFIERLRAGIAARPELAARLRAADTTVCVSDASGACAMTLLLDRDPPQFKPAAEPAEVAITLEPEQFAAVIAGSALLPVVLATGDGAYEGPARRFLAVTPIMRSLWNAGGARR